MNKSYVVTFFRNTVENPRCANCAVIFFGSILGNMQSELLLYGVVLWFTFFNVVFVVFLRCCFSEIIVKSAVTRREQAL